MATRTLVSVDTRKSLAVYEEDGVKRVIEVKLDDSGNPILDAETEAELDRLFSPAPRPVVVLPDTPFVRQIPITKINTR